VGRPIAVVLVDFENILESYIRDPVFVAQNPVAIADVVAGISRQIVSRLYQGGRETFTFFFFPPHHSQLSVIFANKPGRLFVYCPKVYVADDDGNKKQYDTVDRSIYWLVQVIQRRSSDFCARKWFRLGPLRVISQKAVGLANKGILPIYWQDESAYHNVREEESKIRRILEGFLKGLELITDVVIVSGDGHFLPAIDNLRAMGINAISSAEPTNFSSLKLKKGRHEFWPLLLTS
jgi:hypothetical protein